MKKTKKVLHVFNTAGVSNVLNYFLNSFPERHNLRSKLITRLYYEKFGFAEYYNDTVIKRRDEIFFSYLLLIAKKYDILHINANDKILPMLRKVFKNKKIILSYHGTDIREKLKERENFYKHADFVSVSTKELVQNTFEYIPNIIDFSHFHLRNDNEIIKNEAIFFHLARHEIEAYLRVQSLLENFFPKLNLTIIKRWQKPIKYADMPKFLSKFEYYFDIKMVYIDKIKRRKGYLTTHERSYTANQFLTMHKNKKVILKDGNIINGFSTERILKDNLKILDKWIDIYESL